MRNAFDGGVSVRRTPKMFDDGIPQTPRGRAALVDPKARWGQCASARSNVLRSLGCMFVLSNWHTWPFLRVRDPNGIEERTNGGFVLGNHLV